MIGIWQIKGALSDSSINQILPPISVGTSIVEVSPTQPECGGNTSAYIYTLADPTTKEVRYVGKTFNLKNRLSGHLYINKNHQTYKNSWIKSLIKSGLKPEIEALEEINSQDDFIWQEAERFWIETLRFYGARLVNLESGGKSGKRASPETKAKLVLWNTGRKMSLETRMKQSLMRKGRKLSQEHIEKLRNSLLGRVQSKQTREKISAARKGIKFSLEHKEKLKKARNLRGPTSLETRLKMSASMKGKFKGRKLKPEVVEAMRRRQTGKKHSIETRAKMSKSRTGIKNGFWGKRHTEESRGIISLSLIGNKNAHGRLGCHDSPESRLKKSIALIGNKNSVGRVWSNEARINHLESNKRRRLKVEEKCHQKSAQQLSFLEN